METNITLVEGLLDPEFIFSKDELKKYSDGQILKQYLKTVLANRTVLEFKLGLYSFIHRRKRKLSTRN
ncbi:hypothetical protein LG101_13015 [Levilactobacillus brevis]|nr:hypothetical protein LG101_13015 [Levilactobacillus brevis]